MKKQGLEKKISKKIWGPIVLEEYTINLFSSTEIASINFFPFPFLMSSSVMLPNSLFPTQVLLINQEGVL